MYTLSPDFISPPCKEGEEVILKSEKHKKKKRIEYIKEIQGIRVLKFFGINSINEAYKLVGYSICSLSEPERKIECNSLIGFKVKNIKGDLWGTLENIRVSSLNIILEITYKNDIVYVPFNDIIKINKKEKLIIIDPSEGLKDLNKR